LEEVVAVFGGKVSYKVAAIVIRSDNLKRDVKVQEVGLERYLSSNIP
jgi:hypothetical protein